MQIQVKVIILLSIFSIIVIELFLYASRAFRGRKTSRIKKRLAQFSFTENGSETPDILRSRLLSNIPVLERIFLSIPGIATLDKLVQQANVNYPLGFFILLSLLFGAIGYAVCIFVMQSYLMTLVIVISAALVPFFYLLMKKKKRTQAFEKQLPEALELIARSLRAGHAFTGGVKMVTENTADPLGTEFSRTLDEINFGISIADALRNLANRIDCYELKYFVVSVLLQRESGGNLAEIIDGIAHIIRERFKFHDKVKVLAAEGKISAIILVLLPIAMVTVMRLINPEYMGLLFQDPMGRKMLSVAGLLMVIGVVVMTKMTRIRV